MRCLLAITLIASCHWYPEGELRGDIPLVVINQTPTKIGATEFQAGAQLSGHTLEGAVEAGGRHTFLFKRGLIVVRLDAGSYDEGFWPLVSTQVNLQSPTELVVTNGVPPSAASGFAQVTIAPNAPPPPGTRTRSRSHDDPNDCSRGCPAGQECRADGYEQPRCHAVVMH